MPIVERLQMIVKEKGTNFKQLELDCGLGNGVIRRWNEQSPRLDKLVKVANYLNVSLDYLVYGRNALESSEDDRSKLHLESIKEKQGLLCDGSPLSNIEADLIAMFRLLPSLEQEDIFDLVHLKYKKRVERKKSSIYWTYFEENNNKKSGPAEGREAHGGTA